ncbi:G-protein-signaling modulator 2 [Leptolyngbya sp. NIES-3755]|nr:G-protein-signaling modulator 2 [Leptolyngbya sp. NIES-3755]
MDDAKHHNEEIYDRLISLIENSQGRLAPIVVACDDLRLRDRMIVRYENEARQAKIRPYRIVLGKEPSLRSNLAKLKEQDEYLQNNGEAVFTVTGAELLLRVKLNPQEEQSEIEKFFGYLQWTREGLREFRYPIVLWVTTSILREMKLRAADFWSWRKAELRFLDESIEQIPLVNDHLSFSKLDSSSDETLPPLDELLAEIRELEERSPKSAGVATLYDKLGRVYARQIEQGEAQNLEQERERAIKAFGKAIIEFKSLADNRALIDALISLGRFLKAQSELTNALRTFQQSLELAQKIKYHEGELSSLHGLGWVYEQLEQPSQAISFNQQFLDLAREVGDAREESNALNNFGGVHSSLKQYPQALNFYQQSLNLRREIGDRDGEGGSLCNIAHIYRLMGHHQPAIEFYQEALEVQREVGNQEFESNSLGGLGSVYKALGQYQRAIDSYDQCLSIKRKIGDRIGEANSLYDMAFPLAKLDRPWEAIQHYQQAKQIYQELGLDFRVEECDTEIYYLNQVIPSQRILTAPKFDDVQPKPRRPNRQKILFLLFVSGIAIALLIWVLTR